jgi:DivIVA domain-containing protein
VDQQTGIERIRTATFTIGRRGYEKREVEQFLNQIADWLETGGGDQARSDIVKRELERVGQRTAGILATAEDSAQQIRADAEDAAAETTSRAKSAAAATRKAADDYAAKTRDEADRYAARTRNDADDYAGKTRRAADVYADQTRGAADEDAAAARREAEEHSRELVASAEAKAARIVDEGTARRRDVETVIADLVARRDAVIAEANRLAQELRHVSDSHTPAGSDPFAEPAELDPAERVRA